MSAKSRTKYVWCRKSWVFQIFKTIVPIAVCHAATQLLTNRLIKHIGCEKAVISTQCL